ncbi:hypothetical protein MON38_14095 [Hymenobacter sp. DH14]|uniref:Outer membrane protein beta-barrel domain-containing protein n=1 Tax=Hymenobacter cyanobacteriorum TaxID=2926463 RepID=A0A9X2AG80_9BACT|nr:hypothetical protein [Hymenobacter cyanobacteriorum]MCI1188557.1 hypothetical protein [Hymenobacter cyanobacteriorum]
MFPSPFRTLRLALLALLLPVAAAAQTPAPADTARTYKHALGLTASPVLEGFFRNNRSLPLGLLYKRQAAPHRAWRYGAVFSQQYHERYDPQPKTNNAYTIQNLGVSVSVGQEWQRSLSKRWVGYVGVEVGAGVNRYKEEKELQRFVTMNGADVIWADNEFFRFLTYSGVIRPLVGVRYHFLPYLYASAEAALEAMYSHTSWDSKLRTTRTDTGELIVEGSGTYQEHRLQTVFRPIQQVTVHYLFGY